MEAVEDTLKRIITRWVRTIQPLIEDLNVGGDTVRVRTSHRFKIDDEVMLRGDTRYEMPDNLHIVDIIDKNTIKLSHNLTNFWPAGTSMLAKTIDGNFVQGIYIGDPETIPMSPAITINGISEEYPEWLTLDSVKAIFNVEIGVYVESSTYEQSHRFLRHLCRIIKLGLMNNIFPLVNDYATVSTTADINTGDTYIKVDNTSIFCPGQMILIEDQYHTQENRIKTVVDSSTLELQHPMTTTPFYVDDTPIVIQVHRFIYNSFPKEINYQKIPKGSLMKGATINWFGWEEVVPPDGGGGWSDTQIK